MIFEVMGKFYNESPLTLFSLATTIFIFFRSALKVSNRETKLKFSWITHRYILYRFGEHLKEEPPIHHFPYYEHVGYFPLKYQRFWWWKKNEILLSESCNITSEPLQRGFFLKACFYTPLKKHCNLLRLCRIFLLITYNVKVLNYERNWRLNA